MTRQYPSLRFLGLLVLACTLSACSARPDYHGTLPDEARQDPEKDLKVVRVWDQLEVIDASLSDEIVFLSLTLDGKPFRGQVPRSARFDINIQTDWLPVFFIEEISPDSVDEEKNGGTGIQVFDEVQWQEISRRVVESFTPTQPSQGVVINSRDLAIFAYRNPDGSIVTVGDRSKWPTEIPLTAVLRLEKQADTLLDIIGGYLDETGVRSGQALFKTGELGPYARPLVMIDRSRGQVEFLSLEPFTFGSQPSSLTASARWAGWQVVRSYGIEPLNRPISYVSRLFFLVLDSVWDMTEQIFINAFSYRSLKNKPIPPLNDGPGMDLAEWESTLDRMFGAKRVSGTAEFLVDGDEFFPYLIDAINKAETSVKIRTYIFDRDDFALEIADLLKKRSSEVEVKITVDGIGNEMAQKKDSETTPGGYRAPREITRYLRDGSSVETRVLSNPWLAGDHVKTSIIDGEIAFIGGMNIGREYRWEWHDLMLKLTGPVVGLIEYDFDGKWAHSSTLGDVSLATHWMRKKRELPAPEEFEMRMLRTKPAKSEIYRAQRHAIRRAQKYIYIENAYFASSSILYELVKARMRGVDVRVIIPMEGNHGIMNLANVVSANTLLKYGARVYVYPGMSHVKAAIYDGWLCIGSANMDKMSFRVQREMNIASSNPEFARLTIEKVFEKDFATAEELTSPLPENWKNTLARIVASQL
jgi:cardiolipin synthase